MPDAPITAPRPTPRPRPPRAGLVGPLFKWELVRLARRGQDARARFILAVALLFVLTVFTIAWFPRSDPRELFFGTSQVTTLEESARFGKLFVHTFILAQLAILVLLTPAYAVGGISEEKEKKTFEFLLVSDLSSREIVLGKFLGRLAFLLGVMLAGLPILAMTQLYGGVSLKFLLMAYLITGGTVTMLAAVSAAAACAVDTFRGALFRAYGLAALHVLAGCGLNPVFFSPFGFIPMLSAFELDSPQFFWFAGTGYAAAELLIALGAVYFAVRWVRKLRAKPSARPGRAPRGRGGRRDRDRDREPRNGTVRPSERAPVELLVAAEHEVERPADEEVPTARLLPTATSIRAPEPAKFRPRPRPRPPQWLPEDVANRPRVSGEDPFLWKERYTSGTKRTADDDSIRGVMVAVGVVVGLCVGFILVVSLLTALVSGGTRSGLEVAQRLLLTGGSAGFFTYLLMVGSAAAGSVVRERQRLTLESLLTIPVDRRAILWPKWRVSVSRGWWWGLPVSVTVPLGFLMSDTPAAAVPAAALVAASAPFVAGYGLWLSVRCRTVSRAVLWLLPAVGGLVLLPVAAAGVFGAGDGLIAVTAMAAVAGAVAVGAWGFWRGAALMFEREGRF